MDGKLSCLVCSYQLTQLKTVNNIIFNPPPRYKSAELNGTRGCSSPKQKHDTLNSIITISPSLYLSQSLWLLFIQDSFKGTKKQTNAKECDKVY